MGNKFVLTGPRKGQTVSLAGHQFVNGVLDYQGGSKEDIQAVAYHLGTYYGAFHESVAEEAQAKYEADQAALAEGRVPEPVKQQDPPPVKPQDLTPRTPPQQTAPDPLATVQTVAEALQALDPEKDGDWTGQGLPSVDAVSALLARTATRKEIEEAAEGFNRAAAKAAKGA